MKRNILILILLCLFGFIQAQESRFTLSSGYVFTNIEDTDINANGWRLNGLYEFNPGGGILSHGISFGYIGTSAEKTLSTLTTEYKINSWPVYYAPKVTFGEKALKGFVKGALGTHFTDFKRIGGVGNVDSFDVGFYAGASAGAVFMLNENIFINIEYEWVYLSNSYYKDGFMNSAMAGIGILF